MRLSRNTFSTGIRTGVPTSMPPRPSRGRLAPTVASSTMYGCSVRRSTEFEGYKYEGAQHDGATGKFRVASKSARAPKRTLVDFLDQRKCHDLARSLIDQVSGEQLLKEFCATEELRHQLLNMVADHASSTLNLDNEAGDYHFWHQDAVYDNVYHAQNKIIHRFQELAHLCKSAGGPSELVVAIEACINQEALVLGVISELDQQIHLMTHAQDCLGKVAQVNPIMKQSMRSAGAQELISYHMDKLQTLRELMVHELTMNKAASCEPPSPSLTAMIVEALGVGTLGSLMIQNLRHLEGGMQAVSCNGCAPLWHKVQWMMDDLVGLVYHVVA